MNIVKDLWGVYEFHESLLFPAQTLGFQSSGTDHGLELTVPNKPEFILRCLYGRWEVPSNAQTVEHRCIDEDVVDGVEVNGMSQVWQIVERDWSKCCNFDIHSCAAHIVSCKLLSRESFCFCNP